ncbi:rod shape-determining protein MreD [Desulfuromusa kysingii]|uniref:Rod shape-determining protein MreD n=1 Tax=Desulfuromusa kysingii TaxID=37625 RepID=A0A1H4C4C7_9BACT|nr:rod shape-determining protein MreD [Desulfuromusa kysingii]SEA55226.1 rod shape-determining protein MreD [Desulfuromusa kysingii]
MRGFFLFLFTGVLFALLQSSVLPLFFSPNWRPNLILILILYLGLSENLSRALIAGLLLGAIQDSFCGATLGLYLSVYLIIILLTRLLSDQLNVESPPLLLLLIAGGTLLQNFLVGFYLTIFAATAPVLHILLAAIPQQLMANMLSASILLTLLLRFQRLFGYRSGLAGLMYQSKLHGS